MLTLEGLLESVYVAAPPHTWEEADTLQTRIQRLNVKTPKSS